MNTVSREQWEAARQDLLVKEKEHTRARDALAAERRRMPRMAIDMEYAFEGPDGPAGLVDLFEGRRQPTAYALLRWRMSEDAAQVPRRRRPAQGRPATTARSWSDEHRGDDEA